jgi:hypothetical protein
MFTAPTRGQVTGRAFGPKHIAGGTGEHHPLTPVWGAGDGTQELYPEAHLPSILVLLWDTIKSCCAQQTNLIDQPQLFLIFEEVIHSLVF